MDLTGYLIKVVISLVIVLGAALILLPLILRRFMGIKGFGGKGSFEIRKVSPISKNIFVVELEIKGRTYVLVVGEKGTDVIYREDDKDNPSSLGSGGDSLSSGKGYPSGGTQDR